MSAHRQFTADDIIDLLDLEPLPHEGGAFRETYRAPLTIGAGVVPGGRTTGQASATRHASTQIYYLLRTGETSALHRVRHDEVFHFYMGDPVIQLVTDAPGGPFSLEGGDGPLRASTRVIGTDLAAGQRPQAVVRGYEWQGACLKSDANASPGNATDQAAHGWALLGCTVAPGFDWADFELLDRDAAPALRGRLAPADGEDPVLIRSLFDRLIPADGRMRA